MNLWGAKKFFRIILSCRIICCLLVAPSLLFGLVPKGYSAYLEYLGGKATMEVYALGYVSVPSSWNENGRQFINDSFSFHQGPIRAFDYHIEYSNGVNLHNEYGYASAGAGIKTDFFIGTYGLHLTGSSYSGTYIDSPDCSASAESIMIFSIIEPFSYFVAPDMGEKFGDPLEEYYLIEYRYIDVDGEGGFGSIGPLFVRINGSIVAYSPKLETNYASDWRSETYFHPIDLKIGDILSIDSYESYMRTSHSNWHGRMPTAFLTHEISLGLPVSYPAGAVPIPGAVFLLGSGLLWLAISRQK